MANQIRNAGAVAPLVAELTCFADVLDTELEPVRSDADSLQAAQHLGRALANRHGVTWVPRINVADTRGHTGEDVPLYASGPGAQHFAGVLDNAEIPARVRRLLGW
jgi:alkaline phosphatase